jgi:hypothetical protein
VVVPAGPRAWPWVLLSLLLAGCGDGRSLEDGPRDLGAFDTVAADGVADGEADGCAKSCTVPYGAYTCVSGGAYSFESLAKKWAGLGGTEVPLTAKDGVGVSVLDYVDFSLGESPETTSVLDEDGCFVFDGVRYPYTTMVAVVVDDNGTADTWADVGTIVPVKMGEPSVGVEVVGIEKSLVTAWGSDLLSRGFVLAVFLDGSGRAVSGVGVTVKGGGEVYYLDGNIAEPPYYDPQATVTSGSGMVVIPEVAGQQVSGNKPGCAIAPQSCASSPGRVSLHFFNVTCQ